MKNKSNKKAKGKASYIKVRDLKTNKDPKGGFVKMPLPDKG